MTASADRSQIIEQLCDVLDRVTDGRLDSSSIREEARILQDLGLTSLQLLELRFELESVWDVSVSDDDAQGLRTVSDVVTLIASKAV